MSLSWLNRVRKLLGGRHSTTSRRRRFRPCVEALEDRWLPSALPIAVNDSYTITGDAPLFASAATGVLANVSVAPGDTPTVQSWTNPAHAQFFQINGDGSFVYFPEFGFYGTDSFAYTLSDGQGGTSVGTVTFTVNYVDLAPQARPDSYGTVTNTPLTVSAAQGVLHNDFDPDFDVLTAQVDPNHLPAHGTLVLNSNGSFTYTPDPGFSGADSFQYLASDGHGNSASASVYLNVSPAPNVFLVTSTTDDPSWGNAGMAGSLRWAINQADADPGPATIEFAVGLVGSSQTIYVLGHDLPDVTNSVLLDGWSQGGAGYDGPSLITLDGSGNPTGADGLYIDATGVQVRGLTIADFQTGGGDEGNGIVLAGSSDIGSSDVWIYGDRILNNGGAGLLVYAESGGNIIGTNGDGSNDAAEANVISGNGWGIDPTYIGNGPGAGSGIVLYSNDNVVAGNFIGTGSDGTGSDGNASAGLYVAGSGNVIGGTARNTANVIVANGGAGLWLTGAFNTGNVVEGNFIGTDAAGDVGLGNAGDGIHVSWGAYGNTIGGTRAGAANVIIDNGGAGIALIDDSPYGYHTVGDRITGNHIDNNGGLGIDLGPGGNRGQTSPVLARAVSTLTSTTVSGSLHSTPDTTFRLEFFASPAPDPSGSGEGAYCLGAAYVTTDAAGNASFRVDLPVAAGRQYITADATDPQGDTSEFSRAIAAVGAPFVSLAILRFDIDFLLHSLCFGGINGSSRGCAPIRGDVVLGGLAHDTHELLMIPHLSPLEGGSDGIHDRANTDMLFAGGPELDDFWELLATDCDVPN